MTRATVRLPYGRVLRLVGCEGRVAMQTTDAAGRPGGTLLLPVEAVEAACRALRRVAREAAVPRCAWCGEVLPAGRTRRYCSAACMRAARPGP